MLQHDPSVTIAILMPARTDLSAVTLDVKGQSVSRVALCGVGQGPAAIKIVRAFTGQW